MDHETTTLGGDVMPTTHLRRGRPIKALPPRIRELRLTPIDGESIKWFTQDGIIKIVAFEEGGSGTEKNFITIFSSRQRSRMNYLNATAIHSHEARVQKATKHLCPVNLTKIREVISLNIDNSCTTLDTPTKNCSRGTPKVMSMFPLSNEREQYRKVKALGRKRELLTIEQDISDELKSLTDGDRPASVATHIIKRFLEECRKRSYDFPTRTQMEGIVNRLRYDFDPSLVVAFYRRNLNADLEYNHHNAVQAYQY